MLIELIEHDTGDRLSLAATALRTSMMAVFGPRALNEKKFSSWEDRLEVLGLEFDLINRTISMPESKIIKACGRLEVLQSKHRASRSELLKLLGSLRHVCTCARAVKPFYQRIQSLSSRAPLHGAIVIPDSVRQDITWCLATLRSGQFRDLPTTMFGAWPDPDIHLYMDASNMGLAVLDPAVKRFIQLEFTETERELIAKVGAGSDFTINVRGQKSVALATTIWGPRWKARFNGSIGQVWCWIDNTTAVAATNKLTSRNYMAQELNRCIGFAEAVFGFRIRCLHLPGKLNTMADAASRAWAPPFANTWATVKQVWHQDQVPVSLRTIYAPRSAIYSVMDWQPAQQQNTSPCGSSGSSGAQLTNGLRGSHATSQTTPTNSHYSRRTVGSDLQTAAAMRPEPFCPRLAQFHGVIASTADIPSGYTKDISWPCRGCDGCQTDQEGRTKILSLERTGSGWLCPVLAVLDLLTHAACLGLQSSSPLMSSSQHQVIRAVTLNQALRHAAADCGIAPERIGTHSLRAGGATAMMAAGVDLQTIKQFGRWTSDSVDRYTRLTNASSRSLAAQMAGHHGR